MTVKELNAALGAEQVSDLAELNKKLDALLDGEGKEPEEEATEEEAPAAEEPEATTEEEAPVSEEPEAEAGETREAPEEDEATGESVLATAAAVLRALQDENNALKAEIEQLKTQLAARNAEEKEIVAKFKTLFASSGTERAATGDAADAADDIQCNYTDGIGEV